MFGSLQSPEKTGVSENSAAPGAAVDAESSLSATVGQAGITLNKADRDLAKIVAAWPSLPEPIKRAMLTLIG